MTKEQVKTFKAPSPIIILVCVIAFCALAGYIIPAGVYDRVKDVHTGRMVVPSTMFLKIPQASWISLPLLTRALRVVLLLLPFCSW